jgi:mRNA-degrading endonuclease toxin of MazEF toxin-antitoxin module
VKKPEPEIGLVIRYDFLWSHEQAKGYAQGAKDRPCVIVTAIVRRTTGETTVLVAPITHSAPGEGDTAIEIPVAVRRHLRLEEARSYIISNEANSVSWDDPGVVPAQPGVRWAYGRIPKALYDRLRAAMIDLAGRRQMKAFVRKP